MSEEADWIKIVWGGNDVPQPHLAFGGGVVEEAGTDQITKDFKCQTMEFKVYYYKKWRFMKGFWTSEWHEPNLIWEQDESHKRQKRFRVWDGYVSGPLLWLFLTAFWEASKQYHA